MEKMIPLLNLNREFNALKSEIMTAMHDVCVSGSFINGSFVSVFEHAVSDYLGDGRFIGCASGTDALQLALMSLGIQPGDEIITTPFTFVATAEVIKLLGAVPVFVDIDPCFYTIDCSKIKQCITSRTKCILPVHLFGQMCDMDNICTLAEEHGLYIIEDCAQSFGSQWKGKQSGTFGSFGCFSFFPSKNLGAYGDGGGIFSVDKDLSHKSKIIANHGSSKKYEYQTIGINSRLDSLQAAILMVKMKHIDKTLERKRNIAKMYYEHLSDLPVVLPGIEKRSCHTYHQFCVLSDSRDALMKWMTDCGVCSAVYYSSLLTDWKVYQCESDFPIAKDICNRILAIPIDPWMTDDEVYLVVNVIRGFFGKRKKAS